MSQIKAIILTTTCFSAIKNNYRNNIIDLNEKESRDFNKYFKDTSKENYFEYPISLNAQYLSFENDVFIFPSIDVIPKKGFTIESFLTKLKRYCQNEKNTLFVCHKSDLGFDQSYREKLVTIEDLPKSKYQGNVDFITNSPDRIIVFQHDDRYSRNIYKSIIYDSLVKQPVPSNELFDSFIDKYNVLNKPWHKLIDLRNELIINRSTDSRHANTLKNFGIKLSNNYEILIHDIEKYIIDSNISQI